MRGTSFNKGVYDRNLFIGYLFPVSCLGFLFWIPGVYIYF